jgi:hypothetical protein
LLFINFEHRERQGCSPIYASKPVTPSLAIGQIWPKRIRPMAGPVMAVRPEGAKHLWRKNPPRKLSIDLEANERLGRVTGRAGAS